MFGSIRRRPFLVLATLGASVVLPAQAASLTVNSTGDTADLNPGDGSCGTGLPNTCTLRAAIQEANASAGGDDIAIAVSGATTVGINGSYPAITGPVTIVGPAAKFTVDGNGSASLFRITGQGTYSFSNLVIKNAAGPAGGPGGGGIYFAPTGASTLSLTDVDIQDNKESLPM
ncbi:MAG: CSLREA domain-containing protein [Gammaproteobacteria bacterium]|nr:CSLREA domain-containing protein [Gammaproteobacteria bacterium]